MDTLILNLQQNRTISSCNEPYNTLIEKCLNSILLFFGFPATIIIIVKLLNKIHKTRSFSPAEVFLLQINFTNVCLFISLVLRLLDVVHVSYLSMILYVVFFIPTLTARPVFLLAICVIFYLAIVHPVTYMATKTWRHWEWLVITLIWIGALVINVVVIFGQYDFSHPVFVVMFFINLPITMFFNIATLRALSSRAPGNAGQTFDPAKRKAFRIILSILLVLLLYYIPQAYVFIYAYIAPTDWQRFQCSEGSAVLMLPIFTEFAMPVIFLYSLRKLGV